MKTLPLLTAALLLTASTAFAQNAAMAEHFITNWDRDGDGIVTAAEAQEKRGDLFTSFDANEDGQLSPEEYDAFDTMRAEDKARMQEEMAGQHGGNGKGKGRGKGHGMGKGMPEEAGMQRGFNDANGDGQVSREEFLSKTPGWLTSFDANADGQISADDFGN